MDAWAYWTRALSQDSAVVDWTLQTCRKPKWSRKRFSPLSTSSSTLDGSGAREDAAVNGIHDGGCVDHAASEVASVEALDGVLAALDLVELEVDLAGGVSVDGNVHNAAILVLALGLDVFFEFLNELLALLPGRKG